MGMAHAIASRVQLYRALADESRLRLLALAEQDALTVGELAQLLGDSQPQVSRKASALRELGLLDARKEGTRTYLHTQASDDAVVQDALTEGRRLVQHDGSLAKVPFVLAAREDAGRALFDDANDASAEPTDLPWPAHLQAAALMVEATAGSTDGKLDLLVDVGCGDGAALCVLAPFFKRVLAVDRSRARLSVAARRLQQHGLSHVQLVEASFDDAELLQRVDELGGANVVFAGRILHHLSRPTLALQQASRMVRKDDGVLVVLDYDAHQDEQLRQEQGDVWLGFSQEQLASHLEAAGLHLTQSTPIAEGHGAALKGAGPDAKVPWMLTLARPADSTARQDASVVPLSRRA